MTNKYDKRSLPFGNVSAIADKEIVSLLKSLSIEEVFDDTVHERFLTAYRDWILSTKNNTVAGLEQYPYACFSNGTTEAFDKFYSKHNQRRFRFYKGEFVYHRLSCRNYGYQWQYIEDDEISANDAVIISFPFSDTGNKHSDMERVLELCDKLNVPVLIDCIYFGVCKNIDFNFQRDCIKEITFSLSKSFSAHLRIGMRLSKTDDDDPLFVNNKIGYINRVSAGAGLKIIEAFGPDYIFDKYRDRQIAYCEILNVEPSNCVMFGIGDDRWKEYNRDRNTNRLSFHKFLADDNRDLILEIANAKG